MNDKRYVRRKIYDEIFASNIKEQEDSLLRRQKDYEDAINDGTDIDDKTSGLLALDELNIAQKRYAQQQNLRIIEDAEILAHIHNVGLGRKVTVESLDNKNPVRKVFFIAGEGEVFSECKIPYTHAIAISLNGKMVNQKVVIPIKGITSDFIVTQIEIYTP